MLSRVAENLFWMCRYLERADDVRRMLSVNHYLNLGRAPDASQWIPMVETTGDKPMLLSLYPEPSRENVLEFLCLRPDNPNSILSCLTSGRENARAVREKLPIEIWEAVNDAYLFVHGLDKAALLMDPQPFFNHLRMAQERFHGTLHSCLSQAESWQFCQLGIYLERADKATRSLDVKYFLLLPSVQDVGGPMDELGWEAVLRSVSALTSFRQQWHRLSAENVLRFLLFDKYFPRSMLHCLSQTDQIVQALSGEIPMDVSRFPNAVVRQVGQLLARLRFTTIDEVIQNGVHEFLNEAQIQLNQIGDAIHDTFFNVKPSHPVAQGFSQ
ncbi:MAG TPA: alpha-E domain-containing protein [Fibrobacteraceae bacterium]|nr:alpha-E domain-containing protein [Fibrobacteraceae bacterium]